MTDFLLKIFLSPENILGIVLNLLNLVAICVVFSEVGVSWWKALIPIYSTYVSYQSFWKHKWFCLLEFAFLLIDSRCAAIIRKNIIVDVFEFFATLIEKQTLEVDVNIPLLILCILGSILAAIAIFVMKRMTYYKIGQKLEYSAGKIILGMISPIFFLVFVLWGRWKKRINKRLAHINGCVSRFVISLLHLIDRKRQAFQSQFIFLCHSIADNFKVILI